MQPAAEDRGLAARLAGWCAVALVVALPLAFWPPAFGPYHAAKWFVVCLLVPAGLAACAMAGMLRWPRWQWFMPWVVVSVAAALLGVAPWMSVLGSPGRNAGLLAMAVGIGAFVLAASVGGEAAVQRHLLRAAMLTGAFVGALAVAERLGLDLADVGDAGEITRARSTWGSATLAGAHLAMVLPIAVALLRSRDPRWRAASWASVVPIVAGLVATGTRAAWLASVLAGALLIPAWQLAGSGDRSGPGDGPGNAGRPPRSTTRIVALAALVVVVVVLGVFTAPQLGRSSAVGRIDLWSTTPSVIAERPVLGSGPDTQRVVLPAGIDPAFERDHGSEELHDRAHSLPLDALVTTGALGLIALGALLWVLGRDMATNIGRRLVPSAIAAGLAAYLVTLLFAFGDPVIDPLAWLLAGLLWVGVVPAAQSAGTRPRRQWARLVTAAGFGFLTLAGALWAGGELMAEIRLQQAIDARDAGETAEALDRLDSATALAPARFDLHQVAARIVTQSLASDSGSVDGADLVDEAFDHLDAAEVIAGSEDPDLLMDRAELLTVTGDPGEALQLYTTVLAAYPDSFRAHLGIGLAASRVGDLDDAEEAWRTAAELGPEDPRALVNLGILEEQRRDPDAARNYFERALRVDPQNTAARAGLERVTAEQE